VTLYTVEFVRSARRELEQLPAQVVTRVVRAVRALQEVPRPRGSRKLAGEEVTYRLRVGQYRVVYEVDDHNRGVLITRVRHRKEAYQ
jgi:mRNA interferase RelE/StbE